MAIDVSRSAFDRRKRFAGTRMQMGRVLSDDDVNSGNEILEDGSRRSLVDIIGATGTPDGGFGISAPMITAGSIDFALDAGTLYLGGLRLETDGTERFRTQDDWLQQSATDRPAPPASGSRYDLVWIDAVLQDVTGVEDTELLESAYGIADTSARTRVVRRVRVTPGVGSAQCEAGWAAVVAALAAEGGVGPGLEVLGDDTLTVTYDPPSNAEDLCSPAVAGGYLGAENQVIRVQLTGTGSTFTWGYDDSTPLHRVLISANPSGQRRVVTMLTEPPDQAHWPTAGQVVEILPWAAVLPNGEKIAARSGLLARIDGSYDPDSAQFTVAASVPAGFGEAWKSRPDADDLGPEFLYLRVWNRGPDITSPLDIPCPPATAVPLAHTGLRVTVGGAHRRREDHWIIAVRPHTPTQVVPWDLESGRAPHGFRRWVAPLAVIRWDAVVGGMAAGAVVDDCRQWFPPLTRQRSCCTYTVGDGVGSHGHFDSIQDAIDRLPAEGGEVCLLPGRFRQRFKIIDRTGVRVHGCGRRTVIEAPEENEPVVLILDSPQTALESFSIEAFKAPGVVARTTRQPDQPGLDELELRGLHVRSSHHGAIDVHGARGARIVGCDVRVETLQERLGDNGAGTATAVFVGGDDLLVEGNRITASQIDDPLRTAMGGLQIGGGSDRVEVRRNHIRGGSGNGITLGSIVWVENAEIEKLSHRVLASATRAYASSVVIDAHGCLHWAPGKAPPPVKPGRDIRLIPLSEGTVEDVVVAENRITSVGAKGIATADRPDGTVSRVEVRDGVFSANGGDGCLRIEPSGDGGERADLYDGFGGITLRTAHRVEILDNVILRNGEDTDHPVCGLFIGFAQALVVRGNRIEANGRWSGDPRPGIRAGIAILEAAAPPVITKGPIAINPSVLTPAVRILSNVVVHPSGRAVALLGSGPVAVADNFLSATALRQRNGGAEFGTGVINAGSREVFRSMVESKEGRSAAQDVLAMLATDVGAAVFIFNVGKASILGDGSLKVHGQANSAVGFVAEKAAQAAAPSRRFPEGSVLFSDNQVVLGYPGQSEVYNLAYIVTQDDLAVHGNQIISLGLRHRVGSTFFGWTTRINGNRIAEELGSAPTSALTVGTMNATVLNQSTHCIIALGTTVVESGNQTEIELGGGSCDPVHRKLVEINVLGKRHQ